MSELKIGSKEHRLLLESAVRRCRGGCASGCGGSGIINTVGKTYSVPDPENISEELSIDIHGSYAFMRDHEGYRGPLPTDEDKEKGFEAFRKHLNRCPIYRTFNGSELPLQEKTIGDHDWFYCPFYRNHEKLYEIIRNSKIILTSKTGFDFSV